MIHGDTWLVLEKRGIGSRETVAVVKIQQSEPTLRAGQRMLRLRVEVDAAIWSPRPTPGALVSVHAPVYPEPQVVVTELPQTPLTARPEES